jgi:hypothetical protein
MAGVRGRVQRDGEVIHVVADELEDLTPPLRSVGGRDGGTLAVQHGRGDQVTHPGELDGREEQALGGRNAQDIYSRTCGSAVGSCNDLIA